MGIGLGGIIGSVVGGVGGFFVGGPAGAVAGASLGGSLGGGLDQSDAAEDAANIQANSANQANQLQYQMFQEQQALMQPWVQSGQGNLARLNYAMYGQAPSAQSMILDPDSPEYQAWIAANPHRWVPEVPGSPRPLPSERGQTLYKNPLTGEISATPPDIANQMGVQGGGLNPDWRFSTQDWKDSPEYSVYSGARDAALQRSTDTLMAQSAARGMYGSGTMANQLAENMGQLYAQYDPQSLAAARQAAEGARTQEYNMLAGLSSPTGAQQVAQYAGQYGQIAGRNMIGAGDAQAAGQMGAANAWGNALTSGTNQIANAYGQYQGQQNFNQLMQMYGGGYNPNVGAPSQYGVPVQSGGSTFYGNMPQQY